MYRKITRLLMVALFCGASAAYAQYCTVSEAICSVGFASISNVTFSSIAQGSTGCGTTNPGYSDYTTTVATVNAGQTYSIGVVITNPAVGDTVDVWIDYNQNFTFDPNERVAQLFCYSPSIYCTANVTIPTTVTAGNTRLRVLLRAGSAGDTGCGLLNEGEAEDYTLNINTGYCSPSMVTGCDERIANVTFNTINNNSTTCGVTYQGYSDFTAQTTTVGQGLSYNLSVTVSPVYQSDSVNVWIDYNHNNIFEASEKVARLGCYTSAVSVCNTSITIPVSALTGNTRMRAKLNFATPNDDPCVGGSWGEAEDYTVNIQATLPCSGTPIAPNITTAAPTICTGTTTTLNAFEPNTGVSGIIHHWQQSSSASGPWTNVVGGSGATTLTYTTPALSVLTYYRMVDSCTTTNLYSNTSALPVSIVPTPSITTQPGSGGSCAGGFAIFSVTTGPGLLYQWKVNSGSGYVNATGLNYSGANTATLTITNLTTTMNGYTYECVVSNSCGAFVTSTAGTLTVNPATGISTQPFAVTTCPGNNASFSVVATGASLTYQWKENGLPLTTGGIYGGATTANLTITGATLGMNGNVYTCVVSGSCLPNVTSTGATLGVVVLTATATASGPTTICAGSSIPLTANIITGANYQWRNNGSDIPGATGSTYFANATGIYAIYISTGTGCSALSSSVSTTVVATPGAPTITPQGSTNVCDGTNVLLTASLVSGLTYQWQFNGSDIPGATNLSYAASATGSYNVRAINSNNCSDTSLNPIAVSVNVGPSPFVVTPDGPTTICYGSSVNLVGSVPGGLNYQWYDNNAQIIGANSPTYYAPDSGNFTLTITDGNGCSTSSVPLHINFDIVHPVIQPYGNMLCAGIFSTYQWYLNSSAISGATGTCYTPVADGIYSVFATDEINCGAMSNYLQVNNNLSVNTLGNTKDAVKIYPNPASSVIHVDGPANINVSIRSIEGKEVLQTQNVKDIDISKLANGVYVIQVYDKDNNILDTQKLVKTDF